MSETRNAMILRDDAMSDVDWLLSLVDTSREMSREDADDGDTEAAEWRAWSADRLERIAYYLCGHLPDYGCSICGYEPDRPSTVVFSFPASDDPQVPA